MATRYQIPNEADASDEDMALLEKMVEWLHHMTQEWDGDSSGITIYPPLGPNGEVSEAVLGGPGDYVVEVNGVYSIVKGADIEAWETANSLRFVHEMRHATLGEFINVKMTFVDGDLDKVEIKFEDEVLIMSSNMFFAVMGGDAHQLYEAAAEAHQNESLKA